MARFVLVFALMMPAIVNAGWVPVDRSTIGERTIYINPTSIVRQGNIVKLWVLIDHYSVQKEAGDSYLSSKGRWDIDCNANTLRQTFHTIYPGRMGTGGTIWSGPLERNFQPVIPDSIGESLYRAACQ